MKYENKKKVTKNPQKIFDHSSSLYRSTIHPGAHPNAYIFPMISPPPPHTTTSDKSKCNSFDLLVSQGRHQLPPLNHV